MYFTPFENASLMRLGLIQHPATGVFSHKHMSITAVCIPTGFVDNKVITQYGCTVDTIVYNFDDFPNLLAKLQQLIGI